MSFTKPKGTRDLLPDEVKVWQYIENKIKDLMKLYGYAEIRTPMFENTELFHRGVGETSDIVSKEMYTFNDLGHRSITLRPEGTASVCRAFVENNLDQENMPGKFYYYGPMFRYSRPQKGRYRQFYQFGVEAIGSNSPYIDGENIELIANLFKSCHLDNFTILINSVGCKTCRPVHKELLIKYLEEKKDLLCPTCLERMYKNPLRVFDCKNESCQEAIKDAPKVTDHLCPECEEHFSSVRSYLDHNNIDYVLDKNMVRGLDYYTKTAFEIVSNDIGAQSSIGGGGRYDGLIKELGGQDHGGIGFAIGLDRLILALESKGIIDELVPERDQIFLAALSDSERLYVSALAKTLRENNFPCSMDLQNKSFKNQLKYGNKIKARYVIIVGESEVASNILTIKDFKDGSESKMSLRNFMDKLRGEINE